MDRTLQYIAVCVGTMLGYLWPCKRRWRTRYAMLLLAFYAPPRPLKPILQQLPHLLHDRDPRLIGGIASGVLVVMGGIWWYIVSRRLPAEEIERRRREELAFNGRITDGVILDARTLANEDSISPTPEVLVYSYSLAGLTYNCAQDVSTLPHQVLGFRIDQSVQVRYDPRNPGNSIIVSETWTGLWVHPNHEPR
jgi:hypothetical protein